MNRGQALIKSARPYFRFTGFICRRAGGDHRAWRRVRRKGVERVKQPMRCNRLSPIFSFGHAASNASFVVYQGPILPHYLVD